MSDITTTWAALCINTTILPTLHNSTVRDFSTPPLFPTAHIHCPLCCALLLWMYLYLMGETLDLRMGYVAPDLVRPDRLPLGKD